MCLVGEGEAVVGEVVRVDWQLGVVGVSVYLIEENNPERAAAQSPPREDAQRRTGAGSGASAVLKVER